MSKRTVRRVKRYGKSRKVKRGGCPEWDNFKKLFGFKGSKNQQSLNSLHSRENTLLDSINKTKSPGPKNSLQHQLKNVQDQISNIHKKK